MSSLFVCPLCGGALTRREGSYLCPAGHCFDIAREGYTYLLPVNRKHSKTPGDDKAMAAARHTFLEKGYYAPLCEELCQLAVELTGDAPAVLDNGCGEGYYTAGIYRALCEAGKTPVMAGIDISKACGNMIVDIGGGTADIAVISLGGTVVSTSIKTAGDDFDESLVRYMRKKHNLLIGERTAEDIKIKVGSAYPKAEVTTMNVRGRNLVTGLPKTVEVSSEETEEALREATSQIVEAVHSVLEKTPPELASDIADRGIVLTGGGSLLSGLEDLIEAKTGINTMTAEDPMTCVAIGTGKFIEFLAGYRDEVK